jgi:hypothetical protein
MLDSRFSLFLVLGLSLLLPINGCAPVESDKAPVTEQAKLEQSVDRRLSEIFRLFQARDVMGVMDTVAYDYLSNRTTLRSDIEEQLSEVDSIEFDYFIDQLNPGDNHVEVEFHWDRRWREVEGGFESRSGNTTMRLVKTNDEWMIEAIRRDNPFL